MHEKLMMDQLKCSFCDSEAITRLKPNIGNKLFCQGCWDKTMIGYHLIDPNFASSSGKKLNPLLDRNRLNEFLGFA